MFEKQLSSGQPCPTFQVVCQYFWFTENLKKNNIKLFNLRRPFTIFLGACIFVFMNSHLGTIWWVFKSEIKKNSLYTYLILEDHVTRTPPPPKLTKRSSLEKSSNSGSQVDKDVMTAGAVWSQFVTLTISACVKRFLFLTNNHFD